jgi:hypothetical protein
MENAIDIAFNLFRPFLVAGILTVFCYRVVMAFLNQDPKQAIRLLTWGFSFLLGSFLVDIAIGSRQGGAQELISCRDLSHISNCNGWIFYGSSGKAISAFIAYLSSSEIFSMANATIIMSVAGLILTMELTKAVWQAAAPPIVGAFFTGSIVYVLLTNPGYFLSLISDFLAIGSSSGYVSDIEAINGKIANLEALFDSAKAIESAKGVLQTVSEGFQAPIKYLIELLLNLSFLMITVLNMLFLILGAIVLAWLPNLVLFSIVMGAFTRWTLVRWLGYLASLKLIVIGQVWIMGLLPDIKPSGNSFYETVTALGDIGSTVIMTLLLIAGVCGVIVWGSLKLLHLIWLRELMPAIKMGGALREKFGSLPMDRYF